MIHFFHLNQHYAVKLGFVFQISLITQKHSIPRMLKIAISLMFMDILNTS